MLAQPDDRSDVRSACETDTGAPLRWPPLALARHAGCACALTQRRRACGWLVGGLLAGSATAAGAQTGAPTTVATTEPEGVRRDVGRESRFTSLVSADQVEQAANQQYGQLKRDAADKRALAAESEPQLQRLRVIADRIIPFASGWNGRAARWRWEVILIQKKELNAFCMPGGKIAFYAGLLSRLQLSDDEVAVIMGHEMAHALREHARERMGKTAATRLGAGLISSLFGLGDLSNAALNMGAQLLTLRFSRQDESEADLVGLDLAARAGYDPRAGVTLWQKMMKAAEHAPPEFISTHPAGPTRVRDIEATLPKVEPLYASATRPPKVYGPPAAAPN